MQSFEEIRNGSYLYVDKTDLIHSLFQNGRMYFLARPDGFGKSLLLSTLESFFNGKRELFKGLKIMDLEEQWLKYPVIHLDFSDANYQSLEAFNTSISEKLSVYEHIWGKDSRDISNSDRFNTLIKNMARKTGKYVVILIDEYDKAYYSTDTKNREQILMEMKVFFSVLKTVDAHLRFALITGKTRFSELDNFYDISLSEDYNTICGFTEEEILNKFSAEMRDLPYDKCNAANLLSQWCGGYLFSKTGERVFKTSSLLDILHTQKIPCTDTAIQRKAVIARNPMRLPDIPFQNGYLTIQKYDVPKHLWYLTVPNLEMTVNFHI